MVEGGFGDQARGKTHRRGSEIWGTQRGWSSKTRRRWHRESKNRCGRVEMMAVPLGLISVVEANWWIGGVFCIWPFLSGQPPKLRTCLLTAIFPQREET